MFVLRQANHNDVDICYQLALKSSYGIYNLPKDKHLIEVMIQQTIDSFKKEIKQPENELYIFCLEHDGKVIGTSMIWSKFPNFHPIPYYIRFFSQNFEFLQLKFETDGISELCGLYLEAEERTHGLGKLLSFGRFMYIAENPSRFTPKVFAEIRGMIDEDGHCPFWDSVMRPFFNISFNEGVELFVKDIDTFNAKCPPFPIYYNLLGKDVQDSLCKSHPKSVPALKLLQKEGFEYSELIHPLDGGPRVEATIANIPVIQESAVYEIEDTSEKIDSPLYIITSHNRSEFKATLGEFAVQDGLAVIHPDVAKILQLEKGDLCRATPVR